MRAEELRPIRLTDYRTPDWLIESVDLDVSLDQARLEAMPVHEYVDLYVI